MTDSSILDVHKPLSNKTESYSDAVLMVEQLKQNYELLKRKFLEVGTK